MPDTPNSPLSRRFDTLQSQLAKSNVDALILPRFDAHQGEYVASHDERLQFVTGFSGSAGMAIVTPKKIAVFVDGRYTVQVRKECSDPLFSHHHLFDEPPEIWIKQTLPKGTRIGYDPMHVPPSWYDRLARSCAEVDAELVPLSENPVDAIWADQPAPPEGQISSFPVQFAGMNCAAKRDDLIAYMQDVGADIYIDTQPDNIAWFLNVRGSDVEFNPVPQSFLMVCADGSAKWFVNAAKFDETVRDHLPDGVQVISQTEFLPALRERACAGDKVLIDPDFSPQAVRLVLGDTGSIAVPTSSFLTLAKARKNTTELAGVRACHIQDGVAVSEFTAWLTEIVPARAAANNPVSEREAEDKVLALRQARPGFLSESFKPISAAAENAAMCHYATSDKSNAPILPERPYLLDSGGQYETGTTDITRSFSFGSRPDGYDQAYTAVFKAFVALATLRFPKGTQGHHIDAICRRPLWDLGLDYDHGTGHGVGHRLSVHEHPQRIGKPINTVELTPGMVLSIEPGHYVAGLYGIRIENLFEIVGANDGFMEFHNLTWAPIQKDALLDELLTTPERDWLDRYHLELLRKLKPLLSAAAINWLETQAV